MKLKGVLYKTGINRYSLSVSYNKNGNDIHLGGTDFSHTSLSGAKKYGKNFLETVAKRFGSNPNVTSTRLEYVER